MIALQRRLVAVLAADVAGYARLMETREEETHGRLMRFMHTVVEPAIADHRGRLVKNTGDGFLAAFDNAVDAAECALAIQTACARANRAEPEAPSLLFRMGLNVTDAIVEPHDIFGSGVNLAARLQQSAEPGGLVVSAVAAAALHGRQGILLADLGELTLKNMARPAHAFAVRAVGEIPAPPAPQLPPLPDDRPSIAVLPFRSYPADADGAYFAEGIIEGIIHVLSGIQALFVLSRSSTLSYAGLPQDPRKIGQDLGVQYVLQGSVHRVGTRLRVAAELCDTTAGAVVRTVHHDGIATDIFELQDRMAAQVVADIAPAVQERELKRAMRKHPSSMTAYELVLQAIDLQYRLDRTSFPRARGLLQQAMALDPGYGPAYSHAATWHMFSIGQGWSQDLHADVAEAARCASAAIERDGKDATALAIHGHMLSFTCRDRLGAMVFLDRAIAAGPSCAMAWALGSATLGYLGEGAKAVERAQRALQLSPLDPFAFFSEHMLSQAYYVSGDYENAVLWGRRSLARNRLLTSNLRTLAASLVAQGEIEEARRMADRVLEIQPDFRLSRFAARTPFRPEILAQHLPRLRTAGLPD